MKESFNGLNNSGRFGPGVHRLSRASPGFTLLELIIALSLSLFVLVAVIAVVTAVIRYQFEGLRKGQVTGLTLYSLARMHRELENATHLDLPSTASPAGSVLSGCSNWSANMNPLPNQIDSSQPVEAFYYCVDSNNSLLRYSGTGICPYSPQPAPCGSGSGFTPVVYRNFYLMDGLGYFFKRSTEVAGVEMSYIIGKATPTAEVPIPVAYKLSTKVGMNKAYGNPLD